MTKYIKKGGGTMRINCAGRVIRLKPKEVFDETIFQFIPEGFRDLVIPYEGTAIATTLNLEAKESTGLKRNKVETSGDKTSMQRNPKKEEELPQGKPVQPVSEQISTDIAEEDENAAQGSNSPRYIKVPGGGGWFNIIDADTGKKMNENALRSENADELLEQLNSTEDVDNS